MKKIVALLFVCSVAVGQTSFTLTHMTNSLAIANGSTINLICQPLDNSKTYVDVTNTSTGTLSYKVERTDVLLNAGAAAYFCFGGLCYDHTKFMSTTQLTLSPGQSAFKTDTLLALTADLDEGAVLGLSRIHYRISNVNNAKDNVEFVLEYNKGQVAGIQVKPFDLNAVEIAPNPTAGKTWIKFNAVPQERVFLHVFNLAGKEVFVQEFTGSVNKSGLELDLSQLDRGAYFATLQSNGHTVTKRLIIN